jgi:hypothetical protein
MPPNLDAEMKASRFRAVLAVHRLLAYGARRAQFPVPFSSRLERAERRGSAAAVAVLLQWAGDGGGNEDA